MDVPVYETITLGTPKRAQTAGGFTFTLCEHRPESCLEPHGHAKFSICHVLRGGFIEAGRQGDALLTPGTAVAKQPGQEHSNQFGPNGCLSLAVEVDSGLLEELRDAVPGLPALPVAPLQGIDAPIREICQEIAMELSCPVVLEEAALRLLWVLGVSGRRARRLTRPSWLDRVRERLHSDPCASLGLTELAAAAGVHHVHLARSFRARFGLTVGEYLRRLRVRRACSLITSSDLSLVEVAARAGFADQAHMTRTLQHMLGVTPGSLRLLGGEAARGNV